MSYFKETTIQGIHDYFGIVVQHICGFKENTISFVGTGGGRLEAFWARDHVTDTSFTVTCTDITTTEGELWSVVGSPSATNYGTATSKEWFYHEDIQFFINPFTATPFAINDEFTVTITGQGAMKTAGVEATIRRKIDETTASLTFDTSGTISCSLADSFFDIYDVVNDGYNNYIVVKNATTPSLNRAYKIVSIDATNQITVDPAPAASVSETADIYIEEFQFRQANADDTYVKINAFLPGTGTDEINLVYYSHRRRLLAEYSLGVGMFYQYSPLQKIDAQQHWSGYRYVYVQDETQPLWLNANQYAVCGSTRSDTYYHTFYNGWMIPYAPLSNYVYPSLVGGTHDDVTGKHNTADWFYHAFTHAAQNSCVYFSPNLVWETVASRMVNNYLGILSYRVVSPEYAGDSSNYFIRTEENLPYASMLPLATNYASVYKTFSDLEPNPDGIYQLFPFEIAHYDTNQSKSFGIVGRLHFVAAIYGSNVNAEDIIQADGSDWLVVQDIYRAGPLDRFVLRKD